MSVPYPTGETDSKGSQLASDSPITTADGSLTLHSDRYGQTFHSENGAITEARHVFLQACGITQRLTAASGSNRITRILEIGFGLGLNCLLSADQAHACNARLDYQAVEQDLSILKRIPELNYRALLNAPELHDRLIEELASIGQAAEASDFDRDTTSQLRNPRSVLNLSEGITLRLNPGNAVQMALPAGPFHAIYLDAFSPDSNPECWTTEFLARLFACTAPGGVLSTYSAKGSVRRSLLAAGYQVRKLPGPPGKREMLQATRS